MVKKKKTSYKIKRFKRVLKELGLYNAWITNRLWAINNSIDYKGQDIFVVVECNELIDSIINDSFWWDDTANTSLWDALYTEASKISAKICDNNLFEKINVIREQLKNQKFI